MATQIIFQRVTLSNNYEILLVIIYCIFMLSHFSRVQLSETLWTVARQAPLSMEFSRQEYWNGLPFSSPGHILDPGIETGLLNCRQILNHLSYQGSPSIQSSLICSVNITSLPTTLAFSSTCHPCTLPPAFCILRYQQAHCQ